MNTISKADRRYLDELAIHLQRWFVAGERIGEILAEAEAHAAESGESLREAFGDPREYARKWAVPPPPRSWLRTIGFGLHGGLGAFVLAYGATGLAMGPDAQAFGLPAWLVLLVGCLNVVGFAALVPLNRIRDPRTGTPYGWSRTRFVLLALGMCAIVAGSGLVGALLR